LNILSRIKFELFLRLQYQNLKICDHQKKRPVTSFRIYFTDILLQISPYRPGITHTKLYTTHPNRIQDRILFGKDWWAELPLAHPTVLFMVSMCPERTWITA